MSNNNKNNKNSVPKLRTDLTALSKKVDALSKRLDNVLENIIENKIALIKLDVEGFEQEVIEGAMNFILNKKPLNIIFEVNKMVPNQKSNQMNNILNKCPNGIDLIVAADVVLLVLSHGSSVGGLAAVQM